VSPFSDLSEQEVLALVVSSEEDDAHIDRIGEEAAMMEREAMETPFFARHCRSSSAARWCSPPASSSGHAERAGTPVQMAACDPGPLTAR
jgi:hypothetical protein